MEDAVQRYRAVRGEGDVPALLEVLAPDVEVVSPLSGRIVFRGKDDVRVVLDAVYSSLGQLTWHESVGDGRTRVVLGEARVGGLRMTDAAVLELADDGRIRRITPHLRPWLAVTVFALKMAVKVGPRPGLILRALKRP
ncbi:MAG TPA: nuclear transport factor 2 family protein [Solirubrobacteraceae bacterium]|nr:nuclear transport factor 2 family protein [Solirubrobacteraceae bacterium]